MYHRYAFSTLTSMRIVLRAGRTSPASIMLGLPRDCAC